MNRILFRLKQRLRALFRKSELEQELDDELRFHLEKETERNIARGMSAEEAHWSALRSFGGVEQVKEQSRDARGVRWLEELWQELTIFSVAALVLATTGIYGVVSYSVAQRTPELGIRLALGASRKNIFRIILGQGFRLVMVGLALGVIGAFALTRLIRSLMFGVTPNDPLTFIAVSSLLIAITIVAGALPALRATKLDPLKALRAE